MADIKNYEVNIAKEWVLNCFQKDEKITFRLYKTSEPEKLYEHSTDTKELGGNIEEWDWTEDEYEVIKSGPTSIILVCYTAASGGQGSITFDFDLVV